MPGATLGHDFDAEHVLGRRSPGFWTASTACIAAIATASWSRSGSRVVSRCSCRPGYMIACTQRRRRLRPAHLITSNDRPAITGTPTIRVITRIHHAGSPIGANTKIAMIITISRKLVPQRGCSREYSAARSGTSSSSAS